MSKYNPKPIRLARNLYFGRPQSSYVVDYTWVNAYILLVQRRSFSSEIFEYAN